MVTGVASSSYTIRRPSDERDWAGPFLAHAESATPKTKAIQKVKLRQLKKNPSQQSYIWLCKKEALGYIMMSTAVRTVGSYYV